MRDDRSRNRRRDRHEGQELQPDLVRGGVPEQCAAPGDLYPGRDGDSELADLFGKAQADSRKGAEMGKQLLRSRLASRPVATTTPLTLGGKAPGNVLANPVKLPHPPLAWASGSGTAAARNPEQRRWPPDAEGREFP